MSPLAEALADVQHRRVLDRLASAAPPPVTGKSQRAAGLRAVETYLLHVGCGLSLRRTAQVLRVRCQTVHVLVRRVEERRERHPALDRWLDETCDSLMSAEVTP